MFNVKLFLKKQKLFHNIFNVYIERYSFFHFCNDVLAGIKIFALLFPIIISLAILCGESPISGLISCITSMSIYIMFGSTKYQISSISFPICILITEIMIKYQYNGLFITSFFVCIILYVFGKLNIGNTLQYTANAFLSATYVYVALFVIVLQLQYMLGIDTTLIFNNNIFLNIKILYDNIQNITVLNFMYSISFVVLLVLLRLIFKWYISFFLYIIICSIVMLCSEFNLLPIVKYLDITTIGESLFNHLNNHNILILSYKLPSELVLGNLTIFAFAISLIIASQTSLSINIGASLTFDKNLQLNKELIVTGIANLTSVSCGGLFVSPDNELSIQNIYFKSKSVVSMLITVLLLIVIFYLKNYIFQYIPVYSISSILIVLSVFTICHANINRYIFTRNKEKYIFWTTLSVALYFGFVPAVFIGFVLSLFSFSQRIVNIKSPSVYTNKNHDKYIKEFISNKYEYLSTQNIPKKLFNQIEVIKIENILSINLLDMIRKILMSRNTFPKFIIIYFQNIPFLDGEALNIIQKFVIEIKKLGSTVILCGTNGVLFELLQNKEKELNIHHVFGYIIPNFKDAFAMIQKSTQNK